MTGIRLFILVFSSLLIFQGSLQAQKKTYHCRKGQQVLRAIRQHHYEPRNIDKEFNEHVVHAFISNLDPLGLFFTMDEVAEIRSLCPDLSNPGCNDNKNFMERITNLYRFCLFESESMMDAAFDSAFDFNEIDTLFIPEDGKTVYPSGIDDLQRNWEKYLKFQVLRYYFSTYQSGNPDFEKNETNFKLSQDSLQRAILQREFCKINSLLDYPGGFEDYIFGLYLNTLASSFDPHTNYFSMHDKELFESSISRNKISFGADLVQNDEGEIVVSRLIPGGPAWRSGEMNAGDVLLAIRFPKKEPIDLICSNLADIQNMIYNSGSDRIEVNFRTGIGQVKTLELKMEILAAFENAIYSFILEGDRRIGYVSLPGFYTETDTNDPLGCASDLVKEIIKLESDGIDGIILDVRNNGGGSIVEAVDLAGIFIDSGPLCIYRNRDDKPALIKDLKKGAVYTGPLLLMINGYSASASEILAGILQDYHRAVIVGTPSFGKASGQIIFPLGEPDTQNEGLYGFQEGTSDFVKITTTRYYRLSGASHQASGIIPDILLPSHAGFSRVSESAYRSALMNDSVRKNITFEPFPPLPLDPLIKSSKERISANANFILFNMLNDSIKPLYLKEVRIPLCFNAFRSEFLRNISLFSRIDSLKACPGRNFTLLNNSSDETLLSSDNYKSEIHKEIIQNLAEDYQLDEAYFVMRDLIDILNLNHQTNR